MTPPQKTLNEFFKEKYHIPLPEKPTGPSKPNPAIAKLKEPQKLTRQEKKEEKIFMDTMLYAMMAPTVWPNDWSESYPQSTREEARTWRMIKAIECVNDQKCDIFDTLLYVSCASHNAPPNREGYCIAMHCVEKHYGLEKLEENKENLKWLKHDADLTHNEPAKILMSNLRAYIFKCQMQYIKSHA